MAEKKLHTTNYYNTFIEAAEDSNALIGEAPAAKNDKKTVAEMQYEILAKHPYQYTSDDILFQVFADRNDVAKSDYQTEKEMFFSKGQACFRASPLTKKYGFGVHANEEGKIAIYGVESKEYKAFLQDDFVKKVKAMRGSKK